MAMASSRTQDAVRVLAGIAVIAREAALASRALAFLRSGDVPGFASFALARAVNSVSDIAGLSRGSPVPLRPHEDAGNQNGDSFADLPPQHTDVNLHTFTRAVNSVSDVAGLSRASAVPLRPHEDAGKQNGYSFADLPPQRTDVNLQTFRGGDDAPPVSSSTSEPSTLQVETPSSSLSESHGKKPNVSATNSADLAFHDKGSDSALQDQALTIGGPDIDAKSQVLASESSAASGASPHRRKPRERRVPSTPIGRAFGFARLGAGIAFGSFQESAKRLWKGQGSSNAGNFAWSPFMNEQNAERLALGLCRMRGAALKLGQMLSIQDETILPPQVLAALEMVRQGADIMPRGQLHRVVANELGSDWMSRLSRFEDEPIAAASIGQVHKAVLKDGAEVAMKIQYPGVAQSIDSDIENVRRLLEFTNLIPKGMYLEQAMKVAKQELARECDYMLEAANQIRYREILAHEKGLYVPIVFSEYSSKHVLTTELVPGVSIDKVAKMSQSVRDSVAWRLLHLTLQELFVHKFMQTDPNWSNFLYDESTHVINLIDFGAARGYPKRFVDNYLKMVYACANRDRHDVLEMSCKLGFLTGKESNIMLDAHTEAAFAVGLPFSEPGGFDFHSSNLTRRITQLGAVMLRHRLTPPPDEAYSLHRKLSGAFLACIKLRAVVPCREMLLDVYRNYQFSSEN